MKSRIVACAAILLAALPAAAQRRYILRAPGNSIHSIAARYGFSILRQADAGGQVLALVADPAGRPAEQLVNSIRGEGGMAALEQDRSITVPELSRLVRVDQSTVAILDGALFASRAVTGYYGTAVWNSYLNQAASRILRLPDVRSMATGAGTVAVIDTGVDPAHPALSGALTPGYDFITDTPGIPSELDQSTVAILDGSSASLAQKVVAKVNQSTVAILDQSTVAILDGAGGLPPAFGHGTMVAGLVRLAAPTAAIMPLRAFQSDGTGTLYDVTRAVYYAVNAGARVINMSFSLETPSDELQAAISYANARRVVCIASAGNSGERTVVWPAGWKKVEGIASTGNSDARSAFSNFGDDLVSVTAPGEGLITAFPGNNYAAASGTSFSTALVSGAAALIMQLDTNTNQSQAAAALSSGALYLGPGLGAGRIDVFQACEYARRH